MGLFESVFGTHSSRELEKDQSDSCEDKRVGA